MRAEAELHPFACSRHSSSLLLSRPSPLPHRFMGPGWFMSLAYLDPGNLESDLQQGATTGATQV